MARSSLRGKTRAIMSREEFADQISARTGEPISRTILEGIENGERDAEAGILFAIASVTGLSREWLLGDRDIPGYVDPWYPSPLSGVDWTGYLNPADTKSLTTSAA